MRLLAVCAGQAQPIAAKSGRTGHFKIPLPGAVQIGPLGVEGDTIVDTKHHGGPEQAVYLFGEADRIWWEGDLGRPLPAGFFGENLLIDGLASADMCLGDVIGVGTTQLQITAPRIPCVTFAARIGNPQGVKMFHKAARPGAYARVLRSGTVEALDSVTHTPFDGDRITVAENMAQFVAGFPGKRFLERLLSVPGHAEGQKLANSKLND